MCVRSIALRGQWEGVGARAGARLSPGTFPDPDPPHALLPTHISLKKVTRFSLTHHLWTYSNSILFNHFQRQYPIIHNFFYPKLLQFSDKKRKRLKKMNQFGTGETGYLVPKKKRLPKFQQVSQEKLFRKLGENEALFEFYVKTAVAMGLLIVS